MQKHFLFFVLLIAVGLALRMPFLWHPDQVVFDEVHFGQFVSAYYTGEYYFDIHPPLGKLLIAGFAYFFDFRAGFDFANIGAEYGDIPYAALRFLPNLAGALIPAAAVAFLLVLGIPKTAAFIAGALLTLDGALLVQSRFILVDPFLILFGFAGLWLFFRARNRGYRVWDLILAGAVLALSFSVKWTGLAFFGLVMAVMLWDLLAGSRAVLRSEGGSRLGDSGKPRALLGLLLQPDKFSRKSHGILRESASLVPAFSCDFLRNLYAGLRNGLRKRASRRYAQACISACGGDHLFAHFGCIWRCNSIAAAIRRACAGFSENQGVLRGKNSGRKIPSVAREERAPREIFAEANDYDFRGSEHSSRSATAIGQAGSGAGLILAPVLFIIVAITIYLATFWIHFALLPNPGPGDVFMSKNFQEQSFLAQTLELNRVMFAANYGLEATHPDASPAWSWPLMAQPIFYWVGKFENQNFGEEPRTAWIYLLGNPVVWWLSTIGLFAGVFAWKPKSKMLAEAKWILYAGWLMHTLPFLGIQRVVFLYHYLPALVFAVAIFSAWIYDALPRAKFAPVAGAIIGLAAIAFIFFAPLSYGLPLSEGQLQIRMWLPGWR